MMPIGDRPVLWHVMRYYAHFGHTEFVLCLGYGAQRSRTTSSTTTRPASNDFVLPRAASREMLNTDISDWTITFMDTGLDTAIGERLRRVRPYLEDDEMFLANYGDVLTDAPLNDLDREFASTDAVAQFLAVSRRTRSTSSNLDEDGHVTGLVPVADMSMRINGGYFVLRQGIFDYLDEGDDLVMDGCIRAAADRRLRAVRYDGFWAPMDTLKERTALEQLYRHGISPWALWRDRPVEAGRPIVAMVEPLPAIASGN